MKVEYKKIPNGLNDVAKYLGLDPDKTIFMHSTSFDDDNIDRKPINKGRMLYAEILSYVANEKGAKAGICYYSDDFLNYYDEIGFLNKENILKLYDGQELTYPYNSPSTLLNEKIKNDENFRKSMEGYTIVSSYLGEKDIESAQLINGKTLMTLDEQVKFNSKHFFRCLGKEKNFSIAPGLEFTGLEKFDITELRKKYKNSDIWIKLESQSGGSGNLFFENLEENSDLDIKEKIRELSSKIYDEKYINDKMQFICEIDLNSIDNVKIIENIGVNAVVTPNKITILGGTSQATKNGKYIGSRVSEETDKYIKYAQEAAEKAFVAIGEAGYYGYMTIDVLVTEEGNEYKAYSIDPNARFSAGTMLLKNIHYAEEKTGKKAYGISFANLLYNKDANHLKTFKNAAKNLEYDKKTGYGLVPTLINDLTELDKDKYYLKSVLVEDNYDKALQKFEKFKEYFRHD